VNCQRPESNVYLLDGVSNLNRVDGGYALKTPVDAIQEFRILTETAPLNTEAPAELLPRQPMSKERSARVGPGAPRPSRKLTLCPSCETRGVSVPRTARCRMSAAALTPGRDVNVKPCSSPRLPLKNHSVITESHR
jgi:hypothetical protein